MKFTRFAVYQLPFENDNAREMYFMTPEQIEEISDQYELVAIFDARDLEHVFLISNSGLYESLIERVQDMHSVSVGDIIHNLDTDETHVVADVGFRKINMKESV